MRQRRALSAFVVLAAVASACTGPTDPNAPPEPIGVVLGPAGVARPDEDAERGPAMARTELVGKFELPVDVEADGEVWYVTELHGKVYRLSGDERDLVLDVSDELATEGEQGLFDFVIAPDGRNAYIHFTGLDSPGGPPAGNNHIREYEWLGDRAGETTREVLVVEQPYQHHNGGQLRFGPDGNLYIGIGDGGTTEGAQLEGNGDPDRTGQRTDDLLGNILRIEPTPDDEDPYAIADGNPFVGRDGRDEIWAYGLRNPWRFSFDAETADLWIGDVGHRFWEEIDVEPAGSEAGRNYGWSLREGSEPFHGSEPEGHTLPVYEYPHRAGACAIIGGFVYRGTALPDLIGSYLFGDFCTGELQALTYRDGRVASHSYLGVKVESLTALVADADGEPVATSTGGGVYRIVPLDAD